MQAPQAGGVTLSAAKYAALRQSLAAAILKARTDAGAETQRWRALAEAARAEAEALREGLARDLALERAAPLSLPAAVEAVAAACRPLLDDDDASEDARHVSFLRQGAAARRHRAARPRRALTCSLAPSAHRADRARGVRWQRRSRAGRDTGARPLVAA